MGLKFTLTLILPFVIAASASSLVGGPVDKDPTDVKYTLLAQAALVKYENDNGASTSYNVLKVTKVTEQVVAGLIYRIDFFAVPANCFMGGNGCNIINCHAEITDEASWLKQRHFKTKCFPNVYLPSSTNK